MPTATWNGATLAESDETVMIEGNHYFPPESLNQEYFQESDTHTTCPWKGVASYYTITVDGETNEDAAWYYPDPKDGAPERVGEDFSSYVAFWNGVTVSS